MTNAVDYSVDQYASKVIEKAIKSGDPAILARYLSALVNTPENDRARPRVPLIDIASDQYGNVGSLATAASCILTKVVFDSVYFDKWDY